MMRHAEQGIEPITVSMAQAGAFTGLNQATLYRMLERNELATVKVGRRRLVNLEALKKLVGAE